MGISRGVALAPDHEQEHHPEPDEPARWSASAIDGRLPADLVDSVAAQLSTTAGSGETADESSSDTTLGTSAGAPEA
ncbi:hypothetical protein ACFVY9_17870 [Streptomyces sp. NPDC059544]|uniref:hypothetical protein n=1 Tax=unclassified Streptomyces TaxID=2593676 RepID=UPI0033D36A32